MHNVNDPQLESQSAHARVLATEALPNDYLCVRSHTSAQWAPSSAWSATETSQSQSYLHYSVNAIPHHFPLLVEHPSVWIHKLIATGQHLGRMLKFNLSDDRLLASVLCPTSGYNTWEEYRKQQAFFVYPSLPHIEVVLRVTQGSYQKKFKFLFKKGIDIESFLNTLRDYLKKHQALHTFIDTEHDRRCTHQTGTMFQAIELNLDQHELDEGRLHATLVLKDSQEYIRYGTRYDRRSVI